MIAMVSLGNNINGSIQDYCTTYHKYLGYNTAEELIGKVVNDTDALKSLTACVWLSRLAIEAANTPGNEQYPLHGVKRVISALL